ncbi:phospholipase D family protein [candidate division WOR-3 bacterium]|nr:phospholipase D family protein [candidate division WOR-3 bacterium]
MDIRYLENIEIYKTVVLNGVCKARQSIWIATANVKGLQIEEGQNYISILKIFKNLCKKEVKIRILHSGIPSEAFLQDFRKCELHREKNFLMRRCLRVHFKSVLLDVKELFIGSPNFTGAGLGAKGENRRNFEIGVATKSSELINSVQSLFLRIWEGEMCETCGRRKFCYVPLEEPD